MGYLLRIYVFLIDTWYPVDSIHCRYGITDSTLNGTMDVSCFNSPPSFPIIEIDPLFKIRYMSPLYHNNRSTVRMLSCKGLRVNNLWTKKHVNIVLFIINIFWYILLRIMLLPLHQLVAILKKEETAWPFWTILTWFLVKQWWKGILSDYATFNYIGIGNTHKYVYMYWSVLMSQFSIHQNYHTPLRRIL